MRTISLFITSLLLLFKADALEKDCKPVIYYPSFCHQLSAISCIGDCLEIEDGSLWSICKSDSKKVFIWSVKDPLIIYPVKNIFSNYSFKIENLATRDSIQINLEMPPVIEADHSFQIKSIDHLNSKVILSDDSNWKLNDKDQNTYKDWKEGDFIIIGVNECSFFSPEKFILINANTSKYCCVNPL